MESQLPTSVLEAIGDRHLVDPLSTLEELTVTQDPVTQPVDQLHRHQQHEPPPRCMNPAHRKHKKGACKVCGYCLYCPPKRPECKHKRLGKLGRPRLEIDSAARCSKRARREPTLDNLAEVVHRASLGEDVEIPYRRVMATLTKLLGIPSGRLTVRGTGRSAVFDSAARLTEIITVVIRMFCQGAIPLPELVEKVLRGISTNFDAPDPPPAMERPTLRRLQANVSKFASNGQPLVRDVAMALLCNTFDRERVAEIINEPVTERAYVSHRKHSKLYEHGEQPTKAVGENGSDSE